MILVIEDNLFHNNEICCLLGLIQKDEIISCTSVEESLMKNSESPQIIILNYHLNKILPTAMNGEKGIQLFKKIYPNSKVIVFSAQDSLEKAMQLMDVGADEYIIKTSYILNQIEDDCLLLLAEKVKKYLN
jgi:DNA-binding NarL/FixJ family response regulator